MDAFPPQKLENHQIYLCMLQRIFNSFGMSEYQVFPRENLIFWHPKTVKNPLQQTKANLVISVPKVEKSSNLPWELMIFLNAAGEV